MKTCIFCKINKKARDEFMAFLNWLSKRKDYLKIMDEYNKYQNDMPNR